MNSQRLIKVKKFLSNGDGLLRFKHDGDNSLLEVFPLPLVNDSISTTFVNVVRLSKSINHFKNLFSSYSWKVASSTVKRPTMIVALAVLILYSSLSHTHFFMKKTRSKITPDSCRNLQTMLDFPANIYLFKVNNRNTRKRCEICSKLTIKTPERSESIVNFE